MSEMIEKAAQANCPTCANKVKARGFDDNPNGRGDFWRCTAEPIVPAFTGDYVRRFDPPLVNLGAFQPGHPCFEYQFARDCPLYTALSGSGGGDGDG